ncbi:DUF1016 family protein [Xylanimonas allomyrinae]|uniref:DUF1016 family protein n=1 Tax=Xylanimonas allomyrinae TaxID=2509459 RepID=A0A4P6EPL4_9MICO|nr:DUF1016 family protein [Xylanimonas allomyrinae]
MPPAGYEEWLVEVTTRVRATQVRIARIANAGTIGLYRSIGLDILDRQERLGWGAKVIRRLSADLTREFPDQRGWSPSNLNYMRMFAKRWPSDDISQQLAEQLPWGHIMALLDKTDDTDELTWYAREAVAGGWSRDVLRFQITNDLRARAGAAPSNFTATLAPADSDLAQQLTKDPYVFEIATLTGRVKERDLEQALMDRLESTLLELGRGMALVGRQVRLSVDGVDRYIDLLLFHTEQFRYVVIELKVTDFEPEYLGQLGTYVTMVDDLIRKKDVHAPTVGLLLCTGKREATVRYALASTAAAVAVAQWQGLPADARGALPSVEELEGVVRAEFAHQTALLHGHVEPADNDAAPGEDEGL